MVRSRAFEGDARLKMQARFNRLIRQLNQRYRAVLRSEFTVTLGDEFQGLFNDPSVIPDLIWDIRRGDDLPEFRLGIGLGRIDTNIPSKAINLDGPAFHRARAAIQEAKADGIAGAVFLGFGEQVDIIANGIARLLDFHVASRSEKQLEVGEHLRHSTSQVEVASKMGLTPQAVNNHKKALGWTTYQAGEDALRQTLLLGHTETFR